MQDPANVTVRFNIPYSSFLLAEKDILVSILFVLCCQSSPKCPFQQNPVAEKIVEKKHPNSFVKYIVICMLNRVCSKWEGMLENKLLGQVVDKLEYMMEPLALVEPWALEVALEVAPLVVQ